MKKLVKKTLAYLLSFAMIFTMLPAYSYADEVTEGEDGLETEMPATFETYFTELSQYAVVENDTTYPFALDETGTRLHSTNYGVQSNSYGMTVTAVKPFVLTFGYECSSEAKYDKLLVAVNSSNELTASGVETGTYSVKAAIGDVITLKYSKDVSGNNNDDCIYLYDFVVEPMKMITFQGAPAGADIVLRDADSDIVAVKNGVAGVAPGTYTYTVSAFGYETLTGTIVVGEEDVYVDAALTLSSSYIVSFNITGYEADGEALNVVVKHGSDIMTPEADGSYLLIPADYTYEITSYGYKTVTGSFTVSDSNLTIDVTMEEVVTFEQFFAPLNGYATIENNTAYPFAVSDDGSKIYSTNKGVSSKSYGFTMTVQKPFIMSFDYACSTESAYDFLIVNQNGKEALKASGTATGSKEIKASVGDVISFNYQKDSSGDRNDDTVYLSNFTYSPLYMITFQGVPADATLQVTDGDGNEVSLANGIASVEAGTFHYTVTKFGFRDVTGTVTVTDEDVTVDIIMEALSGQKVTFNLLGLKEGETAQITVSRGDTTFDAEEDGSYNLVNASYQYKIKAAGYHSLKGEFTVADADQVITLTMIEGLVWSGDIGESFAGGVGTEEDPYQVSNGEELAYLAAQVNAGMISSDAYIVQTADIDLGEELFTPIGTGSSAAFTARYNGKGHRIDGLKVESIGNYVGLFGYVKGSVRNLTVSGSVTGKQYVGGIVGYVDTTNLNNLKNECDVTSTSTYAGGIAGYVKGSSNNTAGIHKSVNTGNITSGANNFTGGIAGYTNYAAIKDCYNTGAISSNRCGGIVGQCGSSDRIENCYNIGTVTCLTEGSYNYQAAIVAYKMGSVTNCYYLNTLGLTAYGNNGDDSNVHAMSAADLKSLQTISALGGAYVEDEIAVNHGYPILGWQDPNALYQVTFNVNYEDASIVVKDASDNEMNAQSYGIYKLTNGNYTYEVTREECDTITGQFVIDGSGTTVDVHLNICKYPVTFHVTPAGLQVVVTDGTAVYELNEENEYAIELPKGTYQYQVCGFGYETVTGSCTVTGNHDEVSVTAREAARHTVTVSVKDAVTNEVITAALVSLTHEQAGLLTPMEDGTYQLPDGSYDYQVTADGYINQKGTLVVNGADVTLDLMMEEGSNVWSGEISEQTPATTEAEGKTWYLLTSAEDLAWFANEVNNGNTAMNGKLMTNLIMNPEMNQWDHTFPGIGSYSNKFMGTFDGNNKSIVNYYGSGLFGYLGEGSLVENVTIDGSVSDSAVVGAIANQSYGAIVNCHNTNSISCDGSSSITMGGIVGRIYASGRLERCSNTGNVSANTTGNYNDVKIGGIAGDAYCEITECCNYGAINGGSKGYIYVGGILGSSNGNTTTGVKLRNCYNRGEISTGNVTNAPYAGGIAGRFTVGADLVLLNCYNTGAVHSLASSAKVGAITGDYQCNIANAYYLEGSAASAVGYDRDGYTVEAAAMTEAQMKQSSFVTALNNHVYGFKEGSYPVFLWEGGEAVSKSEAAQAVEAAKEQLTLDTTEITEAGTMMLPVSLEGFDGTITWTSSDTAVIGNDGTVVLPEEGIAYVTLTATISLGDATATKDFVITVKSLQAQNAEKLAGAKNYLNALSSLTPQYYMDDNLNTYVQTLLASRNANWTDVTVSVTATGEVTYPLNVETDAAVAEDGSLTYFYVDPAMLPNAISNAIISDVELTLALGDAQETVTKSVNLGWDEERIMPYLQDAAAAAVASIDGEKDENGNLAIPAGTNSIEVPCRMEAYPFVTFTWESYDSELVTVEDNTLNPMTGVTIRTPEEDTEVGMGLLVTFNLADDVYYYGESACTLNLLSESLEQLRLQMQTALDENYVVSKLKDSVTKEVIDPEHVVNDIQLLTGRNTGIEGYDDYRFTAEVSDTDFAQVNGYRVNIYRPMPGETSRELTLTITMSHKNKGISVSKDITVTVDPLTESELQDAVALMDVVSHAYWNGINDNLNENQYKVTHSLHAFQEAYINAQGELVWVYNVNDRRYDAITVGDMADYSEVGGQEAYNKFMSSKPAVIAHENLLLTQPQYNTEVTVSSVLEHEIFAKYAKKYTSGEWYENYFSKLYNIPVSATMTVMGSNGEELTTPLAIVTQPADYTGKIGSTATIFVEATGDGLTYQWYYSRDGKKWYRSSSAGSDTETVSLTLTEARNGQSYRCVITDVYGETVTSEAATLHKAEDQLAITLQPSDYAGKIGDNAQFTVEATGDNLSYQWYYSKDGGKKWSLSGLEGNNTNILTVPVTNGRLGQAYRCRVTNEAGEQVYSEAASISLKESVLKIKSNPSDVSANVGENVTFHVVAEGNGLNYQWYYTRSGKKWYASAENGNNTDTLTLEAKEGRNGQMYRCVITDEDGETVTSAFATLTVH